MSEDDAPVDPMTDFHMATESAAESTTRLAGYLDGEPEVDERTESPLLTIGRRAIGPLESALRLSPSPRHRILIIGLLLLFGPPTHPRVRRVLRKLLKTEEDLQVRDAASTVLTLLRLWEFRVALGVAPGS